MLPPPAADTVESLDMKKALAVLLAMDPTKAAEVLMEMGAAAAAQKLVAMDPDSRNCIIENMAPKAAAVTLVSMEDLMEMRATDAGQVRCAAAESPFKSNDQDRLSGACCNFTIGFPDPLLAPFVETLHGVRNSLRFCRWF
jgi:flagellar motility protein MotE (MotC chaperone)